MHVVRALVRVDALQIRHVTHRRSTRRECRSRRAGGALRGRCRSPCSTLFRLASDTCCGVNVPASLRRPRCSDTSCAFTISVSMSAKRSCWSWKPPIGRSNMTRFFEYDERFLEARHRRAERAPRDAVARLRQAHERTLEPARLRQAARRRGRRTSSKTSSLVSLARSESLPFWSFALKPLRVGRHDEAANRRVARCRRSSSPTRRRSAPWSRS